MIFTVQMLDGLSASGDSIRITVANSLADGGGGGGVSDHGALTGLADDDHTQYHNDARGDARYWPLSTDLATQAELDALTAADVGADPAGTAAAAVTAHEGAANPHPTYLTQAEGDAAYDALGAAAAAQAASQPVDSDLTAIAALTTTAYGRALLALADAAAARSAFGLVLGTDIYSKAAVDSGFQPLDSDLTAIAALSTTSYGRALLGVADLAALQAILGTTGTPSATTYLRGDGSWSTPAGGSGTAEVLDYVDLYSGTVATYTQGATKQAIDGTNLKLDFTWPTSGAAVIEFTGEFSRGNTRETYFYLANAATPTTVLRYIAFRTAQFPAIDNIKLRCVLTGTPAAAASIVLGWESGAGAGNNTLRHGANGYGPLTFSAIALP
jgi:hypothetical protein